MIIKKILTRNRRDFTAIYACEHCADEHEGYGYDDTNFHESVMPDMKCKKCGKSQEVEQAAMQPRHPENLSV